MFDAEYFDTEYVIISKTVAKSVGVVSRRELQTFFTMLEGCRNVDLCCHSGTALVEWNIVWDAVRHINSHSIFKVMPVDCVPTEALASRLAHYNATPSKPIAQSEVDGNWFKQQTQRLEGENDSAFEYRIVRTLAALFRTIKKLNSATTTPPPP